MDIKELKQAIIDKKITNQFRVFVYESDDALFVARQYIKAIAEINNMYIINIEDINQVINHEADIFDSVDLCQYLYVYKTDKFDVLDIDNEANKDITVLCNEVDEQIKLKFNENITYFSKLENWQIDDYARVLLGKMSQTDIDWIVKTCKYNIYRIENEASKLNIFDEDRRNYLFEYFVKDGMLDDLSNYTIFNFSNALITKNIKQLKVILSEIENIDIEPVGLITVLYNNFKNIINVQLNPKSSAEMLGMSSKQFNAVKYNIGYFNAKTLVEIFKVITDIDYRLKSGSLPAEKIIEYLMINVMSR